VLYAIGALPSRPPLPWNISPDLLKEVNALAGAQVGHMMGEGRSMRYQAEVSRISLGSALERLLDHLWSHAMARAAQQQQQHSLPAPLASIISWVRGDGRRGSADTSDQVAAAAAGGGGSVGGAATASLPTLALISGHDTTLLPLLTSLGIWESAPGVWPPFCAAVCFELWLPEEGPASGRPPVVRVVYSPADGDGDTVNGPFRELIRWTLPQMSALIAPLVPKDIDAECQPHSAMAKVERLMGGSQF